MNHSLMAAIMGARRSPPDPNFAFVKYLTNSAVTTDLSGNATSTFSVSLTTDSSNKPFSGSSITFGSSSRLEIGAGAQIAAGDFTIDGWFYQTSRANLQFIWSQYSNTGSGDFANRSILYIDSTGKMGIQKGATSSAAGTNVISLNAWHFFELTRSVNTLYAFIDGVLETSVVISGNMGNWIPCFGHAQNNETASTSHFLGNMSPLRITKGVARNTSGYSIPTDLFPTH